MTVRGRRFGCGAQRFRIELFSPLSGLLKRPDEINHAHDISLLQRHYVGCNDEISVCVLVRYQNHW